MRTTRKRTNPTRNKPSGLSLQRKRALPCGGHGARLRPGRDAPAPFDPPQEYHRHFRHCRPSRDRHPRRLCDLPFKGDLLVPQARHDLFQTRSIGENRMQIREVFDRKRFVLLDGGMGTQLQTRGLQPGQKPELAARFAFALLIASRTASRLFSTPITPAPARTFCWPTPLVPTPKSLQAAPARSSRSFLPRLPVRAAPPQKPVRW